jgi:hypothetical protein
MHDLHDVGGTKGGLGHFLLGLGLAIAGAYLFLDRVSVYGGYWGFFGGPRQSFGLSMVPVMLGVGMLFYSGRSFLGWLLFGGGLLVIVVGVFANLQLHFRQTSLIDTVMMLGMLAAGVGLMIRALSPVEPRRRCGAPAPRLDLASAQERRRLRRVRLDIVAVRPVSVKEYGSLEPAASALGAAR